MCTSPGRWPSKREVRISPEKAEDSVDPAFGRGCTDASVPLPTYNRHKASTIHAFSGNNETSLQETMSECFSKIATLRSSRDPSGPPFPRDHQIYSHAKDAVEFRGRVFEISRWQFRPPGCFWSRNRRPQPGTHFGFQRNCEGRFWGLPP